MKIDTLDISDRALQQLRHSDPDRVHQVSYKANAVVRMDSVTVLSDMERGGRPFFLLRGSIRGFSDVVDGPYGAEEMGVSRPLPYTGIYIPGNEPEYREDGSMARDAEIVDWVRKGIFDPDFQLNEAPFIENEWKLPVTIDATIALPRRRGDVPLIGVEARDRDGQLFPEGEKSCGYRMADYQPSPEGDRSSQYGEMARDEFAHLRLGPAPVPREVERVGELLSERGPDDDARRRIAERTSRLREDFQAQASDAGERLATPSPEPEPVPDSPLADPSLYESYVAPGVSEGESLEGASFDEAMADLDEDSKARMRELFGEGVETPDKSADPTLSAPPEPDETARRVADLVDPDRELDEVDLGATLDVADPEPVVDESETKAPETQDSKTDTPLFDESRDSLREQDEPQVAEEQVNIEDESKDAELDEKAAEKRRVAREARRAERRRQDRQAAEKHGANAPSPKTIPSSSDLKSGGSKTPDQPTPGS